MRSIISALFFLVLIGNSFGQNYCFWVANYTEETFSEIRIREAGDIYFSQDLLPEDLIDPYEHFWIRTGQAESSIFDVEITKLDGSKMYFSWTGGDGNYYTEPYITLDIQPLNTLMLTNDENGNVEWDIANDDIYGFGDPCAQ
jgi:hypothetical protein